MDYFISAIKTCVIHSPMFHWFFFFKLNLGIFLARTTNALFFNSDIFIPAFGIRILLSQPLVFCVLISQNEAILSECSKSWSPLWHSLPQGIVCPRSQFELCDTMALKKWTYQDNLRAVLKNCFILFLGNEFLETHCSSALKTQPCLSPPRAGSLPPPRGWELVVCYFMVAGLTLEETRGKILIVK